MKNEIINDKWKMKMINNEMMKKKIWNMCVMKLVNERNG